MCQTKKSRKMWCKGLKGLRFCALFFIFTALIKFFVQDLPHSIGKVINYERLYDQILDAHFFALSCEIVLLNPVQMIIGISGRRCMSFLMLAFCLLG